MHWTPNDIISLISAIAALFSAYHASRANKKSTVIKANVNGNLERLVNILADSAITIPHDVATRVVSAPPVDHADNESLEEQLAREFFAKINPKP